MQKWSQDEGLELKGGVLDGATYRYMGIYILFNESCVLQSTKIKGEVQGAAREW